MTHRGFDDIDMKLNRLQAMRLSAFPLRNDGEALRLLSSTQDALHALARARDGEAPAPDDLGGVVKNFSWSH